MSIEFRCSQCGKLLRTGDETAGRQAQCPDCKALTQVPTADSDATPSDNPFKQASAGTADNPFGPGPQYCGPIDPGNPYQSPHSDTYSQFAGPIDPIIRQRVSAPATALIVMGAFGLCGQGLGILGVLSQMAVGQRLIGPGPNAIPVMFGTGFHLVMLFIGTIVSLVVLTGGLKMKRLENHSLAMAAAIVAVIPCVAPCCIFSLPFGIWALMILSDVNVKAAFRS